MEYKKTKSRATMKGQKYEIRTAALLYLRCKNNPEISEFQLATNVEGAGALDDVIMRYRTTSDPHTWHTCFLQLKQKEQAKLTISKLKSKANDFALSKYLPSFSTIKTAMSSVDGKTELFNGSLKESQFLIYTNARAEGDVIRYRERDSLGLIETLLKSDSNCAAILGFKGDEDADLIADLENMDAVGCDAREFLQRIKVFTGQPNESELESLIKRELRLSREGNETDMEMFYSVYEKLFEEWWEKENYILTEKSDIYECAVGQLMTIYVENLSIQEKKRFCFDIQFVEDEKLLREDHSSHVSLFHIVASESSPRLSCTKVLQFLDEDNHIFYEIQCLLREKTKILQTWSCGKQRDLVILSRTKNECCKLGREICDILDANSDKRVIVVSQKGDRFANCLKGINTKNYKEVEDICRLSQLEMMSLDRVKDIKIDFQSYDVHLREILDKSNRSLQNIVLDDILIDSLASNETFKIGEALPHDLNYYIPRTAIRPNLINPRIFLAGLKTVFTVSGVTRKELQLMMPPGERVCLASEDIDEGCHFVLLDSKRPMADFKRISKTTPSVHWLHKYGAYMEWKGTQGSINDLRPFIYQEHSTGIVKTDSCFGVSQRTVLLVAEPGMGKTVLVSHIAKHSKHAMPFLWVICVKLADYIDLIETTACDDIVEFLATILGFDKEPFITSLLRHVILETGNVVAFLDGWDEILPNIKDKEWSLLTNLLQTKVKKIWITSRSFLATDLENRLSTLALRLQPFSEDDQIDFLSKYWKEDCVLTDEDLRDIAKNLLSELATSLSDVEKEFTGIPLQTMMLAEVCTDYIINPSEFHLPKKLNLLNLFEKFVDKKFEIYISKTSIIRDSAMLTTLKKKYEETQLNASLLYVFNPILVNSLHSKDEIFETTDILITNLLSGKDNTGIIDGIINSRPKFIHRCFAEFFAGKWFSKHFMENSDFIAEYLFNNKCQFIWIILNSILSRECVLHSAVINNDLGQVENLLKAGANVNSTDIGLRTPLHLAAGGSYGFKNEVSTFGGLSYDSCIDTRFIGPKQRHMVQLLLDYGADVNMVDTVVKSTPLYYALRTATLEAAEILLSVKANADGISFNLENNFPSMLKAVADNGFSNIMGVAVDRGLSSDDIHKHFLIQRSIVGGHLEIVRLLVNDCNKIKSLGPTERSFIHDAAIAGQNEILEYLLGLLRGSYSKDFCREFIGNKDVFGSTAMYYACLNGCVSTLALFEKWGGNLILSLMDMARIFYSSCIYGRFNVVQLMKDKFANDPKFVKQCINLLNVDLFNGGSNLVNAVFSGNTDMLSFLVANGADVKMGIDYSNPVLLVAVAYVSLPAVMALLNSFSDDKDSVSKYINTPDSDGETSLHALGAITDIELRNMCYISSQLLESKAREQADIAKVLIDNGGDINATNVHGCTPLHRITALIGKTHVVTVILESIKDDKEQSLAKYINTPDNKGMTVMHFICTSRFIHDLPREVHEWCIDQRVKTAELLISKRGDVKSVDGLGRTPLHYIAIHTGIIEIAKMLVATLGDKDSLISYINTRDATGKTAKDYALKAHTNPPFWLKKRQIAIAEWLDSILEEEV